MRILSKVAQKKKKPWTTFLTNTLFFVSLRLDPLINSRSETNAIKRLSDANTEAQLRVMEHHLVGHCLTSACNFLACWSSTNCARSKWDLLKHFTTELIARTKSEITLRGDGVVFPNRSLASKCKVWAAQPMQNVKKFSHKNLDHRRICHSFFPTEFSKRPYSQKCYPLPLPKYPDWNKFGLFLECPSPTTLRNAVACLCSLLPKNRTVPEKKQDSLQPHNLWCWSIHRRLGTLTAHSIFAWLHSWHAKMHDQARSLTVSFATAAPLRVSRSTKGKKKVSRKKKPEVLAGSLGLLFWRRHYLI